MTLLDSRHARAKCHGKSLSADQENLVSENWRVGGKMPTYKRSIKNDIYEKQKQIAQLSSVL